MQLRFRVALLAATSTLAAALVGCRDDGAAQDGAPAGTAARPHPAGKFDPKDPAASGMVLTFDDEFTTASISRDSVARGTRWTDHVWWKPPPASFGGSVHDGVLDFAQSDAEMNTINSRGEGWAQKFGYFEARIQFGREIGGGFFLMSRPHAQYGPEPASELDVIESPKDHPSDILTTLHRDSAHPGDRQNAATGGNPWVHVGVDTTRDFHTYGALWDPQSQDITWYFDGRQVMTQPKYDTTDRAPMFMDLIAGQGTDHTYVDYVRAWQFPEFAPRAAAPDTVSPPFGKAAKNDSALPRESAATRE